MHTGPARIGVGDKIRPILPDVPLNLCQDHLTAKEVLNRTASAAGPGFSWTLSGIRGLRFLSFQGNPAAENKAKIDVDEVQRIAGRDVNGDAKTQ